MSTPIIETFAAALATRLATVTVANGYNYTATVVRRTKRATDPAHLQIRIEQGEREAVDGAESRSTWLQPFAIKLVVMPSENDTTALDTHINTFAADVEKALISSETWWTAISGIIDAVLVGPMPFDEDEGYDGCEFTINCHYRHIRGNPYTA